MRDYIYGCMVDFSTLKGRTCINIINIDDEELHFYLENGLKLVMHHQQDCCESVYIESIVGDLNDLIGSEILLAEEVRSFENIEGTKPKYQDESFTWTFYKLATKKGFVDIRWYGTSNGYYSESVSCTLIKEQV